ncbi:MAG: Asp-tRNA(Asn)/Glu-tRNA(Gln) amidotransferase subunit GatC [Actinobacteria bacterium]|nr:Asp-tRNA(Asn)/Glu-tRNA(Gln) amidotransferase subunit GatC [Actinomycetota bacterium]MCL6104986.1 Asp-tRNA(Asn)/Glu-tRNA(Gln) amidotransferase subunit GatC [Actinomycetota bacterium]
MANNEANHNKHIISSDDVVHVAALARLELSEDEVELFTSQLGVVLDYATVISAVDTTDVTPCSHPLPLQNVLRADEPKPGLNRQDVLAQAPLVEDGRFRVPPILGGVP